MTMAYFVPPHPQHSYPSGPHSQQTRFRKSVASATAVTGKAYRLGNFLIGQRPSVTMKSPNSSLNHPNRLTCDPFKGAPLVTTPMPQFISPFQQGPQGYQQPFHPQMVSASSVNQLIRMLDRPPLTRQIFCKLLTTKQIRMYHPTHEHQQQMQYLTAAPQSSTPSPGQAHQQVNKNNWPNNCC